MNTAAKRQFEHVFEVLADFYGWVTAHEPWTQSCQQLAARIRPGARRVVDLGCGPGTAAFALARALPRAQVYGFDLAARMLRRAKGRQWQGEGRGPAWLQGDARALPFKTGSVDAMTGHSFLYLLPEPQRVLREILRCLRSGGQLVLMEPRRGGAELRDLWRLGRGSPRFFLSWSLWRPVSVLHGQYTQDGLTRCLFAAGFEKVGVERSLKGLGLLAVATKH